MERFLAFVVGKVRVPLMVDSTDARVIELALNIRRVKRLSIRSTSKMVKSVLRQSCPAAYLRCRRGGGLH